MFLEVISTVFTMHFQSQCGKYRTSFEIRRLGSRMSEASKPGTGRCLDSRTAQA